MKNTRYARHLLILVALCLVLFVAVRVYLSLPKDAVVSESPPQVSRGSDLELRDVAFTETENGHPVWALKATRASYSKSGQFAEFHDVEVVFFDAEHAERARMSAKNGSANLADREVIARGDVRVVTAEGGEMTTEQVRYRHQDKRLETDELVSVDYLGAQINGQGMSYSLLDKRLLLKANVDAYVQFSPGE